MPPEPAVPPRLRQKLGEANAALARGLKRRLGQELRQALEAGGLAVHYQPRVTLQDGDTCGAEALLRWHHPRRGNIPPGVFIPIAESSDLIVEIGGWVLREATREAARWPADPTPGQEGAPGLVSVNVSARQMRGGVLLGQVARALEESGLPPERLELELTESMLIDGSAETLLMLAGIRDLGVGLALDDFGTGYASLALLKRLPLSCIKLDRSFVRDLPHDMEDTAIVRAVRSIAGALRLDVVAEGVETEDQRAFLSAIGCEEAQGYLFGRPAAAESLRARLEHRAAGREDERRATAHRAATGSVSAHAAMAHPGAVHAGAGQHAAFQPGAAYPAPPPPAAEQLGLEPPAHARPGVERMPSAA